MTESKHPSLSATQEDYLKAILHWNEQGQTASTQTLAQYFGVKPSSVTEMLHRLAQQNLIDYAPYQGAQLTVVGKSRALKVLRRHRLIETFLARFLGYGWEEVHQEADRLEHAVSAEMEERMAQALGYPERDPHGDPIPSREGVFPPEPGLLRLDMAPAESVQIVQVMSQDPEVLELMTRLELFPGQTFTVLAQSELGTRIEQNLKKMLIPLGIAQLIRVVPGGETHD